MPTDNPPATAVELVADLLTLTRSVSRLDPMNAGEAARLRAQAHMLLVKISVRHPEITAAEMLAPRTVSDGVAETTLGVEGLPLVQTGPGGDFTNKFHMDLKYRGGTSFLRKLTKAIGGKLDVLA